MQLGQYDWSRVVLQGTLMIKSKNILVDYVRFDMGMTEGSWDLSQDSHTAEAMQLTCLVVMHPVQNDFWSSVPACNHIAGHLSISVSCQTKVQDLQFTKARERRKGRKGKKKKESYRQLRICF